MAVTTRSEYAIRALLEIAEGGAEQISAQRICDQQELPKKYVERLLGNLKSAGLISSSAGSKGGYTLAREKADIHLTDILAAVEDDSLNPTCNSGSNRFCPQGQCELRGFFDELGIAINKVLAAYSLEDIHRKWKGEKK